MTGAQYSRTGVPSARRSRRGGFATMVREVWQMSDGRIDYFAPLPPSRRHQSAGRDGHCIYKLRIFFNSTASRTSPCVENSFSGVDSSLDSRAAASASARLSGS